MKILIINENRHNSIGGIEKYTSLIANIFAKKKHVVHEFSFNLNPERIDMYESNKNIIPLNVIPKTDKPISMHQKRKYINDGVEQIKSIYKDYDLIINQSANIKWFKEFYNHNKVLYVQHFNPDFYKQKYIAGKLLQPLIYFGMSLIGIKNPFKAFQNFVVYTEYDLKKLKIHDKKSWIIPLAAFNRETISKVNSSKQIEKKGIAYCGRIDNKQKRIKKLVHLANMNKINIDFYGEGQTYLINGDYAHYKGLINKDKIIDILSNYKYLILISKYEGFSFSIVESLSLGVPIIISNFCPSSKYLSNQKGIIIKHNENNLKKIIDKLDENYSKLSKNCIEFSMKNISLEEFKKRWFKVLDFFS